MNTSQIKLCRYSMVALVSNPDTHQETPIQIVKSFLEEQAEVWRMIEQHKDYQRKIIKL